MNILLLSGREHGAHEMLRAGLQARGHTVTVTDLANLSIDRSTLKNDLLILGKPHLFFTYAGQYARSSGVQVIPDPELAQKLSMRTEFFRIARKNDIRAPNFYMGHTETIMSEFCRFDFPLVHKELAFPHGSTLVSSPENLAMEEHRFLYLEEFVEGSHFLVYFINKGDSTGLPDSSSSDLKGEDIRVFEKKPFSTEGDQVDPVSPDEDVCALVHMWRKATKMNFGALEIIRDRGTNELCLINAVPFPEFTHWIEGLGRIMDLIESPL